MKNIPMLPPPEYLAHLREKFSHSCARKSDLKNILFLAEDVDTELCWHAQSQLQDALGILKSLFKPVAKEFNLQILNPKQSLNGHDLLNPENHFQADLVIINEIPSLDILSGLSEKTPEDFGYSTYHLTPDAWAGAIKRTQASLVAIFGNPDIEIGPPHVSGKNSADNISEIYTNPLTHLNIFEVTYPPR